MITLSDTIYSKINTEQKAYIFGRIKGDRARSFPVKNILRELDIDGSNSEIIGAELRKLDISDFPLNNHINFPILGDHALTWAFIRGIFDSVGRILKFNHSKTDTLKCQIISDDKMMLNAISDFCKMKAIFIENRLEYTHNDALDFLSCIYDGAHIKSGKKYKSYLNWSSWVPSLSDHGDGKKLLFKWSKSDQMAVAPFKIRASDSGYDLTIISVYKELGDITFYNTGIKVQPEYGWYFDLVPRSSLAKTGYMLANSIGIIDRGFVGSIRVPLIKIDKTKPNIELPCRAVQLIPRPIIHFDFIEVDKFEETARSDGGFGSTDK